MWQALNRSRKMGVAVLFSELVEIWVWFLSAALVILVARIAWFWANGRLSQPADWNATERYLGRLAASACAVGALASGFTAVYVATRVPWVDNLPALLAGPSETAAISTAAYLFTLPLALAVFAAMLTDPSGVQQVRFKGSREASMRVTIVLAFLAAGYSVWHSIGALAAAPP
jgi:hypothetical protein